MQTSGAARTHFLGNPTGRCRVVATGGGTNAEDIRFVHLESKDFGQPTGTIETTRTLFNFDPGGWSMRWDTVPNSIRMDSAMQQ
jgi:hypothetical protein